MPHNPSAMRVTHWSVTPTVHSDRKNIFAFAGENGAYQVGTLVSGSKTKLDRFDADARLIEKAPQLYAHLQRLASLIEELRDDQVSQHFRFGATEAERKDRSRALATYIESNAEKIDDAVEAAAVLLAEVGIRAEQVPA